MQNSAAAYTGAPFFTSQGILFGAFLSSLDSAPLSDLLLGALGRSWTLLGAFGIDLGPPLGAIWSPLGPLWELLGSSSAPLGSLWELQ